MPRMFTSAYFFSDEQSELSSAVPCHTTLLATIEPPLHAASQRIATRLSSILSVMRKFVKERGYLGVFHSICILHPSELVVAVSQRLNDIWASRYVGKGEMCMPTFYAAEAFILEKHGIINAVSAIAVAFGAIHCAGWRSAFPSDLDAWVWRISSIIISTVPPLWAFADHLLYWWRGAERQTVSQSLLWAIREFVKIIFFAVLPLYLAARFALMIEAFIGLRVLTPGALADVKWTTFIPHI